MKYLSSSAQVGTIIGIVVMSYFLTDIIWGAICRSIVASKNYPPEENHGFAWGFFLGLIGLIVCACKPNYFQTYNGMNAMGQYNDDPGYNPGFNPTFTTPQYYQPQGTGASWICSCGYTNGFDFRYCMKCGKEKSMTAVGGADWICTKCGSAQAASSRFCTLCGSERSGQ